MSCERVDKAEKLELEKCELVQKIEEMESEVQKLNSEIADLRNELIEKSSDATTEGFRRARGIVGEDVEFTATNQVFATVEQVKIASHNYTIDEYRDLMD